MTPACSTRSRKPRCARKLATTSATDSGRFFFPSPTGDYSSTDSETLKMRHPAGHITFARNGENGLAKAGVGKEPDDALRARHVELGEGIVEENDWSPAASFVQARGLEQAQGDRRRTLLAGRTEYAQLARGPIGAADHDEQIITMRSTSSETESDVGRALVLEGVRELSLIASCLARRSRPARVAQRQLVAADRASERGELRRCRFTPCVALGPEHGAMLGEGNLPYGDALFGPQ